MSSTDGSAGTGVQAGTGFSLASGAARTYFCVPPLAANERCYLEVSYDSGTNYEHAGDLVTNGEQLGTVTNRSSGTMYFKVTKDVTAASTQMYYD